MIHTSRKRHHGLCCWNSGCSLLRFSVSPWRYRSGNIEAGFFWLPSPVLSYPPLHFGFRAFSRAASILWRSWGLGDEGGQERRDMGRIFASTSWNRLLLRAVHRGSRCERCIASMPSAGSSGRASRARGLHEAVKYRLSAYLGVVSLTCMINGGTCARHASTRCFHCCVF